MENTNNDNVLIADIQESNRLIAEFMGVKTMTFKMHPEILFLESESYEDLTAISYNWKWEQLMPVCRKIITMYKDNRQDIFDGLTSCDIDKTFKAAVNFIKFWNNPESIILTWSDVPYPYSPMPKGIIKHFTPQ